MEIKTLKRPLLDYFGGKWFSSKHIIKEFPEHKTFVDVFCGAASITLKKKPSKNEIINDIHSELFNLFKVLREQTSELIKVLEKTPYSRDEYNYCREPSFLPVEQARRTIVKSWFGIGDSMDNKTGFRVSLSQGGSTTSPWINYVDLLDSYSERLRSVIIENLDYKELIRRYDKEDTLFYVDPPYVTSTRSRKHAYLHDWKDEQHKELLDILSNIKGKFILSGYDSPDYQDLLFRRVEFDSKSQQQKTKEVLWMNF